MNLGKRQRKLIIDPDQLNMTDKDFTNAVEKGEDLNEYHRKITEKRKARVEQGGPEFSSSDEDAEIPASTPVFKPKLPKREVQPALNPVDQMFAQAMAPKEESDLIHDAEGDSQKQENLYKR